ncbi:protein mono-ADP-ribosyltransferase PARP11-like isoform X2 [Notolabrus celidotus]|uniref:protein mono-ADP-ribosyltransferase PARP11-like isoform X2 n=1 Tax=Notolabrus celidotus TaxID=1203425 RepID=UPI001490570F|nr:protein mono-ADP-ribosyltransferase PARP11-like isoform X2 [Notolabrus celidotus]
MWRNQIEDMGKSKTLWHWYYMADCGRWHRFEGGPDNQLRSEHIEEYYLKNSKGVLTRFSSDCHSKIDFSVMLHTDLKTGKQARIQRGFNIERSCSCFSASPDFWENVDPTCPFQLIPLSELTPEYKIVANYVKTDGLLDRSILSIKRIQNSDLWELFCRKRKQLMKIHGVKEIKEGRLFHGTKTSNVHTICKYNFDLGFVGQNGTAYGKGSGHGGSSPSKLIQASFSPATLSSSSRRIPKRSQTRQDI